MKKPFFQKISNTRLSILVWLPGVFCWAPAVYPPISPNLRSVMDITFTNIKEAKGKMFVAVYDSEAAFLNVDKAVIKDFVPVGTTGSLHIKLNLEKEGRYAVAAFHDLNGNGKIDKNLLGVPTEPYAFSNNARPKFRAPNWSESNFFWKPGGGAVTLKLETW